MRSFSSYILSDSYLAERALDVELGDAADRFWTLVSKDLVGIMDSVLKLLGNHLHERGSLFLEFDGVIPWDAPPKTNTKRQNFRLDKNDPRRARWDELAQSALNRLAQSSEIHGNYGTVVVSSAPSMPNSLVVQLGMTDRYTVVPKSLKKDFERHEFGKQLYIQFAAGGIVSLNPAHREKGSVAGGVYRTLRRSPPQGMSGKSSYNTIVVAGIKSLSRDSIADIVWCIYKLRLKPNLMKAAVAEWVAQLSSELKAQARVGIHEYTHMLDAVRYKTEIDKEPKSLDQASSAFWGGDKGLYYKSNHEWQAYFQETATSLRKNLRSFLDAMVNKGVVATIIAIGGNGLGTGGEKDRIDRWNGWNEHVKGTGFDASKRGAAIAAYIDSEMNRILPQLFNEVDWKFGFKSKEWIDLNSIKRDRFTALAYAYMEKHSGVMFEWLKEDEMRKRFLKRIASLGDDLRKITDDFYAELRSGKSPSKQRWNQAMDNVHHERYLYVGSLMRSKATDVYDVRLFFYQYEMP